MSTMTKGVDDSADYPLVPALAFLQRIWELSHALETLSSNMERRLGVTAQQRLMLRCIGTYPGITAGQLATLLRVDPGTISATLNRLQKKQLLERRRDPRDKRRISLGLTAKGRMLDRPTQGTVEGAVERLLETTPPTEIDVTRKVLGQLASLLEQEAFRDSIAAHSSSV